MRRATRFFRELWSKRESASSHFAWGLALELAFVYRGALEETAFVAVIAAASLWELGGEVVTRRWGRRRDRRNCPACMGLVPVHSAKDCPELAPGLWKSRALDVPPWILGAGAGWIFLSL